MRITIVNQFYVPDIAPTAHLSASLAEHLASLGHDVTVVASAGGYSADAKGKDSPGKGTEAGDKGVDVKRIWTPKLGKANLVKRLADYAAFYMGAFWAVATLPRQDVVVSLTTPPFIAWTAVLHRFFKRGTRIVLWNMDCYPEAPERAGMIKPDGFVSKTLQFFNRRLFASIDHLVSLDTAMQELLLGRYAPKGRELPTSIVPNWERADFFPADATHEPWEGIERLGLDGKFVVLYLGNMGVGHDFATALDAAEQLKDDNVAFLYIGGGKRKDEVAAEAQKRGLSNVVVHSYVPKETTPGVMASTDCALITLRENMLGVMSPSKLHANLAMRLPVAYVGPVKSNVDDAIDRFACGVSVREGDVDTLVSYIRSLASDSARHERDRAAARRAFDEAYNDRVTLAALTAVIAPASEANPADEPAHATA